MILGSVDPETEKKPMMFRCRDCVWAAGTETGHVGELLERPLRLAASEHATLHRVYEVFLGVER